MLSLRDMSFTSYRLNRFVLIYESGDSSVVPDLMLHIIQCFVSLSTPFYKFSGS